MRSLIVTAVGSRCRDAPPFARIPSANAAPKAGGGSSDSTSASGSMTVPLPRGFSTFLIRMGIFLRMTWCVFLEIEPQS